MVIPIHVPFRCAGGHGSYFEDRIFAYVLDDGRAFRSQESFTEFEWLYKRKERPNSTPTIIPFLKETA